MKKKLVTSFEIFNKMNENSGNKYDIQFTKDKKQIVDLLLSLNDNKDFKVKQINEDEFEVIYDGGYNNVYNHKCTIEIIGLIQNNHNKWFWWEFEVKSDEYDTTIEVDNFGWNLGFRDFFIDDYIKQVGNYIHSMEDYELNNKTTI